MKIGVIGFGVVGKALTHVFEDKGFTVLVNDAKNISRPNFHKTTLKEECDIIFVCVPTPVNECGEMDLSIVESCLSDLNFPSKNDPLIVIKSTVTPGTTQRMHREFPRLRLACNPEFLREKKAVQDFYSPDRILLGITHPEDGELLLKVYESWDKPKHIVFPRVAETVKMLANALLVHKVAFACEVNKVCEQFKVSPEQVMKLVLLDVRFCPSHLDPALGKIASNSPCLPKDLSGLISTLEKKGYDSQLLKADKKLAIKM